MIELLHVSKQYNGALAVCDLSLHVAEGELLMLLGGSGCGKTTTLKMINRLVEPTSGSITIAGTDTRGVPAFELRRQVGYVFQRVGLFPHLSVAENIAITPTLLGWPKERIRARVQTLLEFVELDARDLESRAPSELSGGQAQRVGVARALAAEPRILLLDEPFGALDPMTRERLQRTLQRLQKQLGFTAIFVTHDVTEALLLGDRLAVMSDGKLLQVGTAKELREAPADPYVTELLETPERQFAMLDRALHGARDASPLK